ncbi:MAG: ABC transporter permease [Candidatus Acidiferrales bacterium]
MSLRALARNKLRTTLTMLGIIIGVGAVICTVAIGQGAANQVQSQLQSLGENLVYVSAGSVNQGGVRMGSQATKTLVLADAQAIQQEVPTIARLSPGVNASAQVVYQDQNWFTHINGVSPDYLQVRQWQVQEGSNFSQADVQSAADVCLLGTTVVQNLFGNEDAIGKTVRVKSMPVLVIGVLASRGESPFGGDEDDVILMPFSTVQKKLAGVDWLNNIMASATSQADIDPAQQQLESLLRQRHHLRPNEPDDFIIRSPQDIAQAQQQSSQIMTILLASIASVSLLVGGIGIMNIMLVSVTERTREIGIRIAVGATERDVQVQFLAEAMIMSLIGGLIGILFGFAGSRSITSLLKWPTTISAQAIMVAVAFSALVGIFFGYYPAKRAAHMDPIEALRYE